MHLRQFDYSLPPELIAAYPKAQREDSRLLIVDQSFAHCQFSAIYDWLQSGDLLVVNNTKVMKARIITIKPTGGKVALLFEQAIDEYHAWVNLNTKSTFHSGELFIPSTASKEGIILRVLEKKGGQSKVQAPIPWKTVLEHYGTLPLPPYIKRPINACDYERYQTVYAKHSGAIAAPTAGLHFGADYQKRLRQRGINIAEVTLHVGSGTFQPIRVSDISQHSMHSEYYSINEKNSNLINDALAQNARIVAVGTTTLRVLESVCRGGRVQAGSGQTRLFIKPGFRFQVADVLLTNFHLPKSTLLVLICAFGGYDRMMAAYKKAIAHGYRFYSYGDAMLITRWGDSTHAF